jgi:hypothetical protein
MAEARDSAKDVELAGLEREARAMLEILADCFVCEAPRAALGQLADTLSGDAGAGSFRRRLDTQLAATLCAAASAQCADAGHRHVLYSALRELAARTLVWRFRRLGPSRADLWLTDPDRTGTLGSRLAPWSSRLLGSAVGRALARMALGAPAPRQLRPFVREGFAETAARRQPAGRDADVVLFHTCEVDYREPQVGHAALDVLEAAGLRVAVPQQLCCGLPFLALGDIAGAAERARRNVELLHPALIRGAPLLVTGSSCAAFLRSVLPRLVDGEPAKQLAAASVEIGSFLRERIAAGSIRLAAHPASPIACMLPCVGEPGGDAWRAGALLPADTLELGGPSVHPTLLPAIGAARAAGRCLPEIERLSAAADRTLVAPCRHAARALEEALGRPVLHPVELLASLLQRAPAPEPIESTQSAAAEPSPHGELPASDGLAAEVEAAADFPAAEAPGPAPTHASGPEPEPAAEPVVLVAPDEAVTGAGSPPGGHEAGAEASGQPPGPPREDGTAQRADGPGGSAAGADRSDAHG